MELLDYLKTLASAEQEQFAERVGTTINHLKNVAYRQRFASAALAAQIEIETRGLVPVSVTRPKDWHVIWDPRRNQLVNQGAIVGQNDAAADGVKSPIPGGDGQGYSQDAQAAAVNPPHDSMPAASGEACHAE
jgi:hypothetical protein